MNILKEREVPPSKIYQPSKALPDSIYESVGKACRKIDPDADELILYTLSRLFKRPIFDTELKLAGVNRPIGRSASDNETKECKRIMARAGNVLTSSNALHPSREFPDKMSEVLTEWCWTSRTADMRSWRPDRPNCLWVTTIYHNSSLASSWIWTGP